MEFFIIWRIKLKILPLTICHEHFREGHKFPVPDYSHTECGGFSYVWKSTTVLVMAATPVCGWSCSSIPDVTRQGHPRLEQSPFSCCLWQGTKKPIGEDRTSTRLWNRKKTKGENINKVEKIQWQWNSCTWGDGAAPLPWTRRGSNSSNVKHFLLVRRQKSLLYWSLKNLTGLWN